MKAVLWRISFSAALMLLATSSVMPAHAQTPAATPAPAAPAAQAETPAPAPAVSPTQIQSSDTKALESKLAETHEKFRRCAGMQELSIRLNCYDNYAIELGYITPDRVKQDQLKFSKMGVWQVSTKDNGFGEIQTYARTDSLNTVSNRITERHVGLVIRCTPGKTDVFLDWKAPVVTGFKAASNAKSLLVNYNTNNDAKESEEWEVSADQQALFSADPVALIRKIMNKKTLAIHFAPSGANAETARFNIEGLDSIINDVIVKSCYANGMTQNKQPTSGAPAQ